jgi:hypothetical protein
MRLGEGHQNLRSVESRHLVRAASPNLQPLKTPIRHITKQVGLIVGVIVVVCTNTGRYWKQQRVRRHTEQAGTFSPLKTAIQDNSRRRKMKS